LLAPFKCDKELDEMQVVTRAESLQVRNLSVKSFIIIMA